MKVASVIAEFNPLHNAHKYILGKAQKYHDITVVILGGNFMQRGEPSLLDCYIRAEMAVACGADLVLLLPYAFSAQTAEVFAWGGVSIADGIGTTSLIFGSEDDSLPFYDVAELLVNETDDFRSILRKNLDSGMSYASARETAIGEILAEYAAGCVKGANNILSTEYTKAIIRRSSSITPISIKRIEGTLSATNIRSILSQGDISQVREFMPEMSFDILSKNHDSLHFQKDFTSLLFDNILIRGKEYLSQIAEVEEGLGGRIYDMRYDLLKGTEEFINNASTKRYTKSRIRRILYNSLMGYTASDLKKARGHHLSSAVALCTNKNGREYIKKVNSEGNFRIISNLSKEYYNTSDDKWIYDTEIKAYEMYHRDPKEDLLKKHCTVL